MKRFFSIATILLFALASEVNIMAQTTATSPIAPKAEGTMRIMTYNVGVIGKFLTDTFTKEDNVKLIADIVREAEADAVCFQELDSCNMRNNYFQLKALAEHIGNDWGYNYTPAINYRGGTYGSGVAAKSQPIKCFKIFIPTIDGWEDRVVAAMEYEDFVVASTHLNYGQTSQVELINAEMKRLYGDSDKPVFLGGDMNAQPGSEMMLEFEKEWDIISTVTQRSVQSRMVCIDFILQLNNKAPKAKVVDSHAILQAASGSMKIASDHYPVYVDIKLQ